MIYFTAHTFKCVCHCRRAMFRVLGVYNFALWLKWLLYSDEEQRFMYKINQGHLTVFCIVFVWLGGPPSPVRIITQVPWFMYQNRLGPSGGIYYPNFVPCFVVLYLNCCGLFIGIISDWHCRLNTLEETLMRLVKCHLRIVCLGLRYRT